MVWGNPWIVALLIVAVILVGMEALARKSLSWSLLSRLGWLACLAFLVADLSFVKTRELSEASALHVVVDVSDSVVRIPERLERLKIVMQELKDWSSRQNVPLKVTQFAEGVEATTFESLRFGGYQTFLNPALQATPEGSRIILLSDGLWVDGVRPSAPIVALSIGEPNEKDLWIENAQRVYTAFLKNRLKILLNIGHKGFEGEDVQVSLKRGDEVLDSQVVRLQSSLQNVEVSVFPEKMGEESLLLSLEPLDGELSSLNNEIVIRVRTVRDKMRILHVGGKPSADLKAWRSFLTRQPDIDLVSFYILRSTTDDPQARNSDLSLIPFPYDDLFSTELDKFDLVILHNFDFTLYFQPFYLANLARFVREGGALFMIGGDQSFHRYDHSPLKPLLPLEFVSGGSFVERDVSLSNVMDHPVMSGLESALKSLKLSGLHTLRQRPDAFVLAQYRSGEPFLSAWDVEEGRVVALNSDESWKLQMQPREDAAAFSRLARKILQYLTFDPEVSPTQIVSSKWNVGQDVKLGLSNKEAVLWSIEPMAFGGELQNFGPSSEVSFKVPDAGWYRVNALQKESKVFETEQKPWLTEWKYLISRPEKLRELAQSTEGSYVEFEDRQKIFEPQLVGKQTISAEIQSWTRGSEYWAWIFLISSLFLLCLDFYLRKHQQWDA